MFHGEIRIEYWVRHDCVKVLDYGEKFGVNIIKSYYDFSPLPPSSGH